MKPLIMAMILANRYYSRSFKRSRRPVRYTYCLRGPLRGPLPPHLQPHSSRQHFHLPGPVFGTPFVLVHSVFKHTSSRSEHFGFGNWLSFGGRVDGVGSS